MHFDALFLPSGSPLGSHAAPSPVCRVSLKRPLGDPPEDPAPFPLASPTGETVQRSERGMEGGQKIERDGAAMKGGHMGRKKAKSEESDEEHGDSSGSSQAQLPEGRREQAMGVLHLMQGLSNSQGED